MIEHLTLNDLISQETKRHPSALYARIRRPGAAGPSQREWDGVLGCHELW